MIDRKGFNHAISDSDLITNPKLDLPELISQYNETLCTILEKHAPLGF